MKIYKKIFFFAFNNINLREILVVFGSGFLEKKKWQISLILHLMK